MAIGKAPTKHRPYRLAYPAPEIPRSGRRLHGDPSGVERCDPEGLEISHEELTFFDNVAAYSRQIFEYEETIKQNRVCSAHAGDRRAETEDGMERARHEALLSMGDRCHVMEVEAITDEPGEPRKPLSDTLLRNLQKCVDPFLDFHVPAGPDQPLEDERESASKDSIQEEGAMANPWFYVYSVIRMASRHRLCAWIRISAEDVAAVERGVWDCGLQMCNMRYRPIVKNHEWWGVIMDEEDQEHLEPFLKRREKEDMSRTCAIIRWGADPDVIDSVVDKAVTSRRAGESVLWPAQYMSGLLHGLVIWMDVMS
ncbi:hypothetical protein K488DRAFT_81736 [Vararia minispora EC-137]|uniref:Uncharacterized protein n=1 Tax=Vararia minispora EC-137 TaxID=1314806 RepID=A0ACB8QYW4_9AGAM|nr:hypothetical protein K488DRAFT_81736 [Vararia minispora EC-137]